MPYRITKFGLKNFRVFKDQFDFDLSSLTVLTGPNNSGKSSLIKAILLLKENEDIINDKIPSINFLKYIRGEHNLGNHKYTINTDGENTVFSFTYFKNYKYNIEVNNKGEIQWDYLITTMDNNLVIGQRGGVININVQNFIHYLNNILSTEPEKDSIIMNSVAKKRVKKFILALQEFSQEIDVVDIDLFDIYSSDETIKKISDQYESNLKNRVFKVVLDLESEIVKLDEDVLDLDWFESLRYLFHVITNVVLTKDDILYFLPMAVPGCFQFDKIVFIPTIKESLKRAYSESDYFNFQAYIQSKLYPHDENLSENERIFKTSRKMKQNEYSWKIFENFDSFMEKWIAEFEIGEEISFGYDDKSDTYYIRIDDKSLLEYGMGYSQILYLLLSLSKEVRVSSERRDSSQRLVFPTTYILEEPETSLHPAFQSKLALMIIDAISIFNINFIIETHSEYFIRKLQLLTAEKVINPGDVVLYYFTNPKKVNENEEQVKRIVIDKFGSLSDNFGPGFIDESTSLKFDLIKLNKNQYKGTSKNFV